MAAMQKRVAETVQNLPRMGCAEKNGSDAGQFAVGMQKVEQKLYGLSTKFDTAKRGYGGLTQLIRFYSPNPPNSRSILNLLPGSDAENRAERRAVVRADANADTRAEHHADPFADLRAVACVGDCAEKIAPMQKPVQSLVQKDEPMENLKLQ